MNALTLEHVRVELGGNVIVDDVTLAFERSRRHAVIGRSGAGKSVLMKAAAGLLPIANGTVTVAAKPLVFVHQDPALLDTLDVRENVAFAVERRVARNEVGARVDAVMRTLGIEDVAHRAPAALPIALQKRVALARALALEPGVLVVDEPTTGLDPIAARQVDDALASLEGTTLIVITHSPRTLARLRPDVVVVEHGTAHRAAARAA